MSPASYRAAPPRVVCFLVYLVVACGGKSGCCWCAGSLLVPGAMPYKGRATSGFAGGGPACSGSVALSCQPPPWPGVGEDGGPLGGGDDGGGDPAAALAGSDFLVAAARSSFGLPSSPRVPIGRAQ